MTDQSDGVGLLVDIEPAAVGPVMSSFTSVPAPVGSSLAEMSDSVTSSLATRYYSSSRALSEDDPFGCDLRALSTKEPTAKQCLNNNPNTGLLVQISDSESSGTSVSKSLSQYPSGISMSVSQYPSMASNGSVSGTSVLFGNLSHISGPGNRLSCTQDSRFSLDIPSTDADEVFNSVAENKDGAPDWDRLLNEAQYLALSLKDDKSKTLQTPANKLKKQATRTRLLNFSPGEGLESPLQELRADFLVQNTPEKSPKTETDLLLVDIGDSPKKDPSRKMTFNEQPQKEDVVELLDVQNELPLIKDVQLLNINNDGAIDIKTKVNGVFESQNLLEFSPKCSQVKSYSSKNPSIKSSPLSKSPKSSLILSPTNKTPGIGVEEKKQKKNLSTIKENVPPTRITPRMRHQVLKKPQRSPLAANNSSKPNLAKSNNVHSAKITNDTSAKTHEETNAKSANNSAEAVIKATPAKVKTSNARRTSMTTPQSQGITSRKPLISPLTKPMKPRIQSSPLATPLSSSNEPNSKQGPVMKGSLLNRKTGLSVPSKVAGITPMSKLKSALTSKVPGITPMSKPSTIPNTSNLSRVTPVRAATSSLKKPSLNSSIDGSGLVKPGTSSLVKPGMAKPSSNLSSLGRSRTSLNFNQSSSLAKPTLNTSAATNTSMSKPTLPRPSLNNSMSRPQGLPRPLTSMPRPQMSRPGSKNSTPAASPRVGGLPLVSSTPAVPRPRPLARGLPSPIGVKRRTAQ